MKCRVGCINLKINEKKALGLGGKKMKSTKMGVQNRAQIYSIISFFWKKPKKKKKSEIAKKKKWVPNKKKKHFNVELAGVFKTRRFEAGNHGL